MSMCDARCRRCGRRIGWAGEPRDQPACPRCGTPPDAAAIAADQAEIDRFRELLHCWRPPPVDPAGAAG